MKRFLITLIVTAITFFHAFCFCAQAMLLHGNAQYNAEDVREQTFRGIKYNLNPETFRPYWSDPNHFANYETLKDGKNEIENRHLSLFSDGTYGVRYRHDPYHNYYYDTNGILFKIDVLNKPFDQYPHRSVAYNRYGGFKNATFVVSKDEQYLYDINKKLMGHWVNSACYDEDGNVLMLRKNSQ